MKKYRDSLRLVYSILFFWLYIPHFLFFAKTGVKEDVQRIKQQISLKLPNYIAFLYLLHNNRYFRSLFYFRIGAIVALLIGWWRPGDRYFQISYQTKIGKGMLIAHPYSTIINADFIGDNFSCLHCTTLGDKRKGRPVLGNNVKLGANVTIIGDVKIGDNVIIGAGSVVVKDIPSDCVVAGNPAKIIRYLDKHNE